MVSAKKMRVGSQFLRLRENFRRELTPYVGDLTDSQFTDELACFIENEKLDKVMLERARRRRGRFF